MNNKPIIGVCPLWDEEKNSYRMPPGYMDNIMEAGGIPVILPFCEDAETVNSLMNLCSGFLFTGGHDVSPSLYGETAKFDSIECCLKRDTLEKLILGNALALNKSILGICRGMQFINAYLGGTLYQDLPSEKNSKTEHRQLPPYDVPVHTVTIKTGTPLYKLLCTSQLFVNSHHHQAVKTLAPELECMAVSEDGITEGVYMPGKKFVWAVQWHPERSYKPDINSKKIFSAFIKSITD